MTMKQVWLSEKSKCKCKCFDSRCSLFSWWFCLHLHARKSNLDIKQYLIYDSNTAQHKGGV